MVPLVLIVTGCGGPSATTCPDGPACVAVADAADAAGDHSATRRGWTRGCNEFAYAPACRAMGERLLRTGLGGTGPEPDAGLLMLDRACDLSDGDACITAGRFRYDRGDLADAAFSMRRACDLGRSAGCVPQGVVLADDPATREQGLTLLRAACDSGDREGCRMFADALVTPPAAVAVDWSAAKAAVDALVKVDDPAGWSLEASLRIREGSPFYDIKLGYDAAVKACVGGDDVGCYNQGALVENRQVDRPPEEAVIAYDVACNNLKYAPACARLGYAYQMGRGAAIDKDKAFRFYGMACEGGERDACEQIKTIGP